MASEIIKPEDVADWLLPSEAAAILKTAFDSDYLAKGALLERLRGGMLRAIPAHQGSVGDAQAIHLPRNPQLPGR